MRFMQLPAYLLLSGHFLGKETPRISENSQGPIPPICENQMGPLDLSGVCESQMGPLDLSGVCENQMGPLDLKDILRTMRDMSYAKPQTKADLLKRLRESNTEAENHMLDELLAMVTAEAAVDSALTRLPITDVQLLTQQVGDFWYKIGGDVRFTGQMVIHMILPTVSDVIALANKLSKKLSHADLQRRPRVAADAGIIELEFKTCTVFITTGKHSINGNAPSI